MSTVAGARFPSESTLASLVNRIAQGDEVALTSFYDETSPLIYGLLRRMLEHSLDAEEALLDVYMRAWKNASTYSVARGGVQPWLAMMARSIAIDHIRQRRTRPAISAFPLLNTSAFTSSGASPEQQTINSQRRAGVHRVLAALPPSHRQVVLMAFFSGLTHSELAVHLGQPLGTVKSRIRIALMKLRDLLERQPCA